MKVCGVLVVSSVVLLGGCGSLLGADFDRPGAATDVLPDGASAEDGGPGVSSSPGEGGAEGSTSVDGNAAANDVIDVSAGNDRTCAVRKDGKVYCWGGDGFYTKEPPAVHPVPKLDSIVDVEVADGYACVLRSDGQVLCWGNNYSGQLGRDPATNVSSCSCLPDPQPVAMPAGMKVVQLSLGRSHMCARTDAGDMYCWGTNTSGQLAIPLTTTQRYVATEVAALHGQVVDIACSRDIDSRSTCAVTKDGRVWCWGNNAYGQLGRPPEAFSKVPTPVTVQTANGVDFAGAVRIGAGEGYACALTQAKELHCWGFVPGILPDVPWVGGDTSTRSSAPHTHAALSNVAAFEVGADTVMTVDTSGKVLAFGSNKYAELGTGQIGGPQMNCRFYSGSECIYDPTRAPLLDGAVQLSVRDRSGVFRKGGAAWTWGYNGDDQLGHAANTGGDQSCDYSACNPIPGAVVLP